MQENQERSISDEIFNDFDIEIIIEYYIQVFLLLEKDIDVFTIHDLFFKHVRNNLVNR